MDNKVTGELIREQGRQLRDLEIEPGRAAELAIEVERHTRAILATAVRLDFNDEPSRSAAALQELKRSHPAGAKPRAGKSRRKGK